MPLVFFKTRGTGRSLFRTYWTGGASNKGMKGEDRREPEVMREKLNLTPGQ